MTTQKTAKPQIPEFHYDRPQGNFWLRYGKEPFLNLDARNVKLHLRAAMVKVDSLVDLGGKNDDYDYGYKLGDHMLITAQRERGIDYAGPLAGYKAGPFTTPDGKRILVTSEARPVEAKRGSMSFLEDYIGTLLGEQFVHALYWLKFAYESLLRGDLRPAPLLVLAGPSGCGKSFFQHLVTRLLGGRCAKPWRYMIGETQFNSDLAEAEHLYIEDEAGSVDIRSRRALGDAIKQITVVENWSVHAKGRKAVTLSTFKRATMTVNDEPEKLAVLPPLDTDMLDKIALLHCTPAKLSESREQNAADLEKELPALAYVLTKTRVPKSWQHPRYGARAFQNPYLLEMLSSTAPESRLLDFMDSAGKQLFADGPWEGTAADLERILCAHEVFGWQAQKLLPHSSTCGTLLSRLKTKFPARFEQNRSNGQTRWTIQKA